MTTKRVESLDHFVDEGEGFFQVANHFCIYNSIFLGLGYTHHFLISEVKYYASSQTYRVAFIHYQPPPEGNDSLPPSRSSGSLCFRQKGMVLETHIKFQRLSSGKWKFLEGHEGYYDLLERGEWTRVVTAHYPETPEKRDDAATRARQHIGTGDYSIFNNNCEHFVTRMLTGKGISYQIKQALKKGSKAVSASAVASSALVLK